MLIMEPLADPMIPGSTYRIELNQTDPNIIFAIFCTVDGVSSSTQITEDGTYTIPDTATRTVWRVQVNSGSTVDGTISPKVYAV